MTHTGRAVLLASGVFYLVAVINDSDGAFVICWTGLSLLISCFLLSRASLSGLQLECHSARRPVTEGQQTFISVNFHNAGSFNKTGVGLELFLRNETQGVDFHRTYGIEFVQGGDRLSIPVPLPNLYRGSHRLLRAQLIGNDPVGLFRFVRSVSVEATLLVYPRSEIFQRALLHSRDAQRQSGRMVLRQSATSPEFFGVREYHPGDDLRWVHWPATARHGRLILREFEATIHGSAQFWIDLSAHQTYGQGVDASLEWALRIAASLIHDQVFSGRTVSVHLSARSPVHIPGRRGVGHFNRVMEALATARADGNHPVHETMAESLGLTSEDSVVLVTADVENVERIARLVARRGAEGTVILLNPESFAKIPGQAPDKASFDEAIDCLERRGCHVAAFHCGDSVRAMLSELQQGKGVHRRGARVQVPQQTRSAMASQGAGA
ncbi:MAG: hypothetical protein AUJ92_01210 [Armatimonadetes bacterium CG2_30_59_28]|nr:DUF58 domain-containing protein [Armatimonadota bacterium]OIO98522.1 MAG: hypothetical protein AUJ92_01210 [Armatimonadetes bacterium CG2_30_59_28]PIU63716.1 MAG: hypothetical protein COS85_15245 [Armatimonadetes bacterium CG07_land_8_20_14_0_80_59_28]PIX40707.1 MAG: hypothetical protein COZ56_14035 [Armatimonadetes bacterium CG_4_8_14_3_um_filter_58_9]PIY43334.1 MAG: hypothetical protein COZ05_11365 [Armatimonadetes bacterium CG_4_10_14_3_um_filter_59_10]PJB78793.1 MAG: hypothetical protei